jgi:hypothetical protein
LTNSLFQLKNGSNSHLLNSMNPIIAESRMAETCERLLRPIARLALESGMTAEELEALIRQVVLEERRAVADWNKRWARLSSTQIYGMGHA